MANLLRQLDDKYLLSPKVLYFFLSLQFYALHQFRGNFALRKFNIEKSELGYGLGLLMLITFVTNVGIATLNDKYRRPKTFISILLALSGLFFQLFYVKSITNAFQGMFWVVMLCHLLATTAYYPLLDKIVLDILNKNPNVSIKTYGKQRSFGSIAFLAGNFMVEKLITKNTEKEGEIIKSFNFEPLRYYQLTMTVLSIFLVLMFVHGSGNQKKRDDMFKSWGRLLGNTRYMFFILIILLNGITRAAMTIYLGVYLTDIVKVKGYDLSDSPAILRGIFSIFNTNPLATTTMFAMMFEIMILFKSSAINKLFGLYYPLFFAQIFQLIRFVCYYIMSPDNPNAFLFVCLFELLKGVNFGLTHICGVQIATILCPTHLKTTSQMIYSGAFTGISSTIAGLTFGRIFTAKKSDSDESYLTEATNDFKKFFIVNIAINSLCLILFVFRYGLIERKLVWPVRSRIPRESRQVPRNGVLNNGTEERR